jgi:polyphosphate kinase
MPRNLRRRIETLFPVDDEVLAARVVRETFDFGLADNVNASILLPQGGYERIKTTKNPVRSQMACLENARILSARVAEAVPSSQPFPIVNFPSGLDET